MRYVVKRTFDEGAVDAEGRKIIYSPGQEYTGELHRQLLANGLIEEVDGEVAAPVDVIPEEVIQAPQVDEVLTEAVESIEEEPVVEKNDKKKRKSRG